MLAVGEEEEEECRGTRESIDSDKTWLEDTVAAYLLSYAWKSKRPACGEAPRPCRKRTRLTSYSSPAARAISSIDPFRAEKKHARTETVATPRRRAAAPPRLRAAAPPPSDLQPFSSSPQSLPPAPETCLTLTLGQQCPANGSPAKSQSILPSLITTTVCNPPRESIPS